MPVQISCPTCSQTLRVPDTAIGKSVRCPKCQTVFAAEQPGGPPPAANDPFSFNSPSSAAPANKDDPFADLRQEFNLPAANVPPAKGASERNPFGESSAMGTSSSTPYDNPYASPTAYGAGNYTSQPAAQAGIGLPWETEPASFASFANTIKLIMFEPDVAFLRMRQDGDFVSSLTFAMLGIFIGFVAYVLWLMPMVLLNLANNRGNAAAESGALLLLYGGIYGSVAVASFVMIFVHGAILHLCMMMTGAATKDIGVTIRVLCWTSGAFPWLFLVPCVGGMVAGIWQLVVTVLGLTRAHDTDVGKVILAMVVPFLACCLVGGGIALLSVGLGAAR